MIKLFISDIDGCLSEPYQTIDLDRIVQVSRRVKEGGRLNSHAPVPAFSLCSGRPIPYVECMAQLLGIQEPVLFESGGGMFNPRTAEVRWNPRITPAIRDQLDEVAEWMIKERLHNTSMVYDYAKRTQAGLIGPYHREIADAIPHVREFVEGNGFDLKVQPTHLSIDVVPLGMTKEFGMAWLAEELDIELSEIAYIGDSISDLAALQVVGRSFAPENAAEEVKDAVDTTTGERLKGVLDAMEICIRDNRAELRA